MAALAVPEVGFVRVVGEGLFMFMFIWLVSGFEYIVLDRVGGGGGGVCKRNAT